MKNKVVAAITRHRMLEKGGRVLVALSGGADSIALLHVLLSLREEWGLTIGAVHLNHQLRGSESLRDEHFVRDHCGRRDIPLAVERAAVELLAKQAGESIEQCGRRLRYELFEREAGRQEAKVATAHTASDNAETVLINMIRGTALRGLGGIPPVRGRFIRPLIDCTREEIEAFCREHALSWAKDSTNQSDDYTRNRIRRHIIPLLKSENPRVVEGLTRLTNTLREDAGCLDNLATQLKDRLTRPDGNLERAGFLQAHPALRSRVLAQLLREARVSPQGELIEWLSTAITKGQGSRQLSGQVIFSSGLSAFSLKPTIPLPAGRFFHSLSLSDLERAPFELEVFPGKKVILSLQDANNLKKTPKDQKKDLTYCLDYDKIEGVVNLRPRLPGDKLRLPGRGCTKTLKNLFQEAGVPPEERARAILLADGQGVLWAQGIGPDERATADEGTKRVIAIALEGGIDG